MSPSGSNKNCSSENRRYPWQVFLLVLVAPIFSACSASQYQRDLKRLETSITSLRSVQAEQSSQIATLQDEVRRLNGKFEELEFSQGQRLGTDLKAIKEDISNLRQRVPPPSVVPQEILDADDSYAHTLGTEPARLLNDALLFMREGKFKESASMLTGILELGSKDQITPLALFWLGVASDGVGDNRGAIRAYNDLITLYPKHDRLPAALLRQAAVLTRLGDPSAANLTLKKLITDFPRSAEAAEAKTKIKAAPAR